MNTVSMTLVDTNRMSGSVLPGRVRSVRGASAAARCTAKDARMRLTRRGRAVLGGLALAAMLGVGSITSQAFASPPGAGAYETTVVSSGQTLWGIASDIAQVRGDRDVRDVVLELQRLNGMATSALQAGQELRVPVVG